MSIGSNNPPDMTVTAAETEKSVSDWMAENPVILTEEMAREAKVFLDRGKLCIDDLEAERGTKVKPLNEQVKAINDHYRPSRESLARVNAILTMRVGAFIKEEADRRQAIAAEAAAKAAELEKLAREAEEKERAALANADAGELGVDVSSVTKEADAVFAEYATANRAAQLAEKATNVKIGGGFTRAMGLRTKEELTVVDAAAAISDIGITEDIREAILKGARAYRRLHEELPSGVTSNVEKKL